MSREPRRLVVGFLASSLCVGCLAEGPPDPLRWLVSPTILGTAENVDTCAATSGFGGSDGVVEIYDIEVNKLYCESEVSVGPIVRIALAESNSVENGKILVRQDDPLQVLALHDAAYALGELSANPTALGELENELTSSGCVAAGLDAAVTTRVDVGATVLSGSSAELCERRADVGLDGGFCVSESEIDDAAADKGMFTVEPAT